MASFSANAEVLDAAKLSSWTTDGVTYNRFQAIPSAFGPAIAVSGRGVVADALLPTLFGGSPLNGDPCDCSTFLSTAPNPTDIAVFSFLTILQCTLVAYTDKFLHNFFSFGFAACIAWTPFATPWLHSGYAYSQDWAVTSLQKPYYMAGGGSEVAACAAEAAAGSTLLNGILALNNPNLTLTLDINPEKNRLWEAINSPASLFFFLCLCWLIGGACVVVAISACVLTEM